MKKALIGFVLLGGIVVSGCKKGENDPFLSLRSRKARVCGEFTVTAFESIYLDPISNESHTEILKDGIMTITDSDSNGTSTESYGFAAEYSFSKDGTFFRRFETDDYSIIIKGAWFFIGKNKEAELKNKEAIGMVNKEVDYNNPGNSYVLKSNYDNNGTLFILNQLKEKEIILQQKGEYDDGSTYNTVITLSKK